MCDNDVVSPLYCLAKAMSHEDQAPLPLSKRVVGPIPATSFGDVVKLCDPLVPLDPLADAALREDLDELRGGNRLARLARTVRRAGSSPTLQFLTGHVGSGKTTELLQMKRRLEAPSREANPPTVLILDGTPLVDISDVDLEDVLVLLWKVVFEQAPTAAARVLPALWKQRVRDVLGKLVLNLPDKVLEGLSRVIDQLRLLPTENRRELRVLLTGLADVFIKGLNDALDAIREERVGSVVLIIDNLEKLNERKREIVEHLYLERLGALRRLDAHLVITAPSYLAYASSGGSLIGLYGGEIVVLPMIKVRERAAVGGDDYKAGVDAMADLLQKRVDFKLLFADGPAAAQEMARASGGCIRHALRMVRSAVNEQDDPPVVAASVERAIASVQADLDRALPEKWIKTLRHVAETNNFPSECDESTKREMLRHLFVLEYQNGEPEAFYGVHPLVERCRKYRETT